MTNSTRRDALDRRTVLKTVAVGAGLPMVAGCTGNDDTGENGDSSDLDDWFENVGNYDGVADETGSDEITVAVGAENGFAFDPPAIRIDSGTTVVWEWTGEGGNHNVVAKDGSFRSEMTRESGHTFDHAFEEAGTYRYVCEPHEMSGMKGAVVVE